MLTLLSVPLHSSTMQINSCLAVVMLTLAVLLIAPATSEAGKKKIKLCKWDNLYPGCLVHSTDFLTLVANGTGLPANEQELEQLCL